MARVILFLAVFFLLTPSFAFAHALGIDCKVKEGKVWVETFYDDDTPAAKAKVKVLNAQEEVIADGVTDNKGMWSFDAPEPGKYVVRIDAGAGHRAKKSFVIGGAPASEPKKSEASESVSIPVVPSIVSDGPTREEFTRVPWLKLAIGVTVIGACGGAFVVAQRLRKTKVV